MILSLSLTWNVRKVNSENDATVMASTVQAGDFSLPCYVLKKNVSAGTELAIFVRPATSVPPKPAPAVLVKGTAAGPKKRADQAPAAPMKKRKA